MLGTNSIEFTVRLNDAENAIDTKKIAYANFVLTFKMLYNVSVF